MVEIEQYMNETISGGGVASMQCVNSEKELDWSSLTEYVFGNSCVWDANYNPLDDPKQVIAGSVIESWESDLLVDATFEHQMTTVSSKFIKSIPSHKLAYRKEAILRWRLKRKRLLESGSARPFVARSDIAHKRERNGKGQFLKKQSGFLPYGSFQCVIE